MKNETGITLISLIVTVALLVLITSIITAGAYDSTQLQRFTKLNSDIKVLRDRIAVYYIQNDTLPVDKKEYIKEELSEKIKDLSVNDGDKYYKIDLTKIDNITLNYDDEYIINEESHEVYNLKGVTYKGIIYHTIGQDDVLVQEYQ